MREYTVIYERGPKSWSAYVPDLPGCVTVGKTREETERNIQEAIALWIEVTRDSGSPVPEPSTESGTVRVAA